jgi:hypothetical protein
MRSEFVSSRNRDREIDPVSHRLWNLVPTPMSPAPWREYGRHPQGKRHADIRRGCHWLQLPIAGPAGFLAGTPLTACPAVSQKRTTRKGTSSDRPDLGIWAYITDFCFCFLLSLAPYVAVRTAQLIAIECHHDRFAARCLQG